MRIHAWLVGWTLISAPALGAPGVTRAQLEGVPAEALEALEALELELGTLDEGIEAAQATLRDAQGGVSEERAEIGAARDSVSEAQAQVSEARQAGRSRLELAKLQVERASVALDGAKRDKKVERQELGVARAQGDGDAIEAARGELIDARAALVEVRVSHREARAALRDARRDNKDQLEASKEAVEEAREDTGAAKAARDEARDQVSHARAALELLRAQRRQLEARLELSRAEAVVSAGTELDLQPFAEALEAADGDVAQAEEALSALGGPQEPTQEPIAEDISGQ